jgi:hypothetical protein
LNNLQKHREKAIWFVIGVAFMLVVTFWAIYENQPKQFNCDRAANVCDFSGGGGSGGSGGGGGCPCASVTPYPTYTPVPTPACYDSDGGIYPDVAGSCTDATGTHLDLCFSYPNGDSGVAEKYCRDGVCQTENKGCVSLVAMRYCYDAEGRGGYCRTVGG